MQEKIANFISRFKVINIPFFIGTFALLTLLWFLFIPKPLYIGFIIFLSIMLNPPVILGLHLFNRLRRFLSINWKNLTINSGEQNLDFYKLSLRKLTKLKTSIDFWGKKIPKSILVSHLLVSWLLEFKRPSKIVNPTNSPEEDAKYEQVIVSIRFSHSIMAYVQTYIFDKPKEQKEEYLKSCLDSLPSTISNSKVREMAYATHSDGEGFLSTLFTLYDLYFYLALPSELKSKINNLFLTVIPNPNNLGWLGHRFFEYIVYRKCKGGADENIKVFLNPLLQLFYKEKFEKEQKKYFIRNELLKNL